MFDKERIDQLRKENYLLLGFPGVILGISMLFIINSGSSLIGGTPNAEHAAIWVMFLIIFPISIFVQLIHYLLFGRYQMKWNAYNIRDLMMMFGFYIVFAVISYMEKDNAGAYFSYASLVYAAYAILIFIQSRGKRWGYVFVLIAVFVINLVPYIEMTEEGQNITDMMQISYFALSATFIISGFSDFYWMLRTLRKEQEYEYD